MIHFITRFLFSFSFVEELYILEKQGSLSPIPRLFQISPSVSLLPFCQICSFFSFEICEQCVAFLGEWRLRCTFDYGEEQVHIQVGVVVRCLSPILVGETLEVVWG